ncbi:hypothetical protein MML48_3g00018170 [Holotrichia oblita]|uniref:Uncharacterized protein n=1 Tax=Holotrichia oblita TaxID=644536 RepID=A0ACB9TEJ4_HOLOL|nr:hypothetical protein MML48_3g00018170 [Holotrichia oblita]
MQNICEIVAASVRGDKKFEGSDLVKKLHRVSQPRDIECVIPRVVSDRDQHVPLSSNQIVESNIRTCHIIADKYVLLDNVEGSSLCRCLDVKTQEELVCKVSIVCISTYRSYTLEWKVSEKISTLYCISEDWVHNEY